MKMKLELFETPDIKVGSNEEENYFLTQTALSESNTLSFIKELVNMFYILARSIFKGGNKFAECKKSRE